MGLPNMPKFGAEVVLEGVEEFLSDIEKSSEGLKRLHEDFAKPPPTPVADSGIAGALTDTITVIGGVVGVATAAASALSAAYGMIVEPVIQFNRSIRDSAELVGITTESYSRMVGAAETLGISQTTLATSLRGAIDRGLIPSIEHLAALADEAVKIQNPIDRDAFLTDKLGASWTTLWPLLRQGGDAFIALTQSIEESLVVTESEIEETEELDRVVKELGETFKEVGREAGQFFAHLAVGAMEDATRHTEQWGLAVWMAKQKYITPTKNEIDELYRSLDNLYDRIDAAAAKDTLSNIYPDEGPGSSAVLARKAAEAEAMAQEIADKKADADLKAAEAAARTAEKEAADIAAAHEKLIADLQKMNTDFFSAVEAGQKNSANKLTEYARQFELGGAEYNIFQKSLENAIQQGIIQPEDARKIAEQILPAEVIKQWASDTGYEMGDKLTEELRLSLKKALTGEGLTDAEANNIIKAFKADPAGYLNETIQKANETLALLTQSLIDQNTIVFADAGTKIKDTTDAAFKNLELDLTNYAETYSEWWVNPIRAAIEAADELIAKHDAWLSNFPEPVAHPGGPQEGTGPIASGPASALGGPASGPTTNMNLTVNSSAPTEQVVSDFRMMQALAKSGRGFIQ